MLMDGSSLLASVAWRIGGLFCHQLPDRSPQFDGTIFPLCFRCAGLHLSVLVAFAWLAASGGFRRRLPELRYALAISALTVPLMVDGLANATSLWSSDGWLRALTGAGVGLVLPLLLVPLAQRPDAGPAASMISTMPTPFSLLTPVVTCAALLWLLVHPIERWIFQALALAASAAPALFLFTFFLAGWRNRIVFGSTLGFCDERRSLVTPDHRSAIDGAHLH
jgi:uncharacterized membrane protein